MVTASHSRTLWIVPLLITICLLSFPAQAKYSGGTGEPNDPYQIATAADLIALGKTPEDYGKHFILTADIDLDPNLPGRKVFDRAIIAPDIDPVKAGFQGTAFRGVFDGDGHTISRLTIAGDSYLGLFGQSESGADVRNLGVVSANIGGSGDYVGGLAGCNWYGRVTQCYSTGAVSGTNHVGGLVGENCGRVTGCYGTVMVTGKDYVGGLIGYSYMHEVTYCYSTGTVSGSSYVGGLVGFNNGAVTECYSTGAVSGRSSVGGLVGDNGYGGTLTHCYSTGAVSGDYSVGGLMGWNSGGAVGQCYSTGAVSGLSDVSGLVGRGDSGDVIASFWDTQTSGQAASAGGTGKTTAEMKTAKTFLDAGWDFVGEVANGTEDIWRIDEGKDYPRLWWENAPQ